MVSLGTLSPSPPTHLHLHRVIKFHLKKFCNLIYLRLSSIYCIPWYAVTQHGVSVKAFVFIALGAISVAVEKL